MKLNETNTPEEAKDAFKLALENNYKIYISKYAFILENYLVNSIFERIKEPSLKHLIDQFTSICVDFVMLRLFISGYTSNTNNPLNTSIYIIQKYSKALSHNAEYKSEIAHILQQDYASVLSQITMLIYI
ncbi:hypothetical protein [Kurthia sp. Dielmo]|uniref:hypothetical protein n=1 Tax=Kurthia sp. Dielmo TaxID=1033738 RepID=UPI0005CC5A7A|nr:hypothetical protein [Kurthia sp. Dielmo]